MIKNICFDMGGVLYGFSFKQFVDELGLEDPADRELLLNEVFINVNWVRIDRGTPLDESYAKMLPHIPERLVPYAHACVYDWGLTEQNHAIPGMAELVYELRDAGYGLYLFSNAGQNHHTYWPKLPLAPVFGDRIMLSADHKTIKPEPGFFLTGAKLFSLTPDECVFIDDNQINVEGSLNVGFHGIVFHGNADRLRGELRALGVNVRA